MRDILSSIRKIIQSNKIRSQKELLAALNDKKVFIKPHLLPDYLKRIPITKKNGFYIIQPKEQPPVPILKITIAGPNMLVLHTAPTQAMTLAFWLDQRIDYPQPIEPTNTSNNIWPGMLGTISGYDTVLVIVQEGALPLIKERLAS